MVFVFSSREQEAGAQQYPRDTYHATFVHDFLDDPTGLADNFSHQQPRHLDAFLPVLQHVPRLSNALPALLNTKRNFQKKGFELQILKKFGMTFLLNLTT